MNISLGSWFWIVLIALESVLVFPGRTYLMSDTQIYIPLFEHLADERLLQRELILEGAHLRYTVYDEVTLFLHALTKLDFEWVLLAQQIFFRLWGVAGSFLLARACGLGSLGSLLASGVLWMGAFVYGPAIITTEFEPVPRGFAVPLTMLALGLRATAAPPLWAGLALGCAFLYHAPAIWPILLVALALREWKMLAPVAASAGLLLLMGQWQEGSVSAQPFFSLLAESHRKIQQARAPYNWLYLWLPRYFYTFLLTGSLALLAAWQLRQRIPAAVRPYFTWLPLIGAATIPLSYFLLERLGWALFPQVQPMRSLLYCHLFCQCLGAIAAGLALQERRYFHAGLWLLLPLSLAIRGDLLLLDERKLLLEAFLIIGIFAVVYASRWPASRLLAPGLLLVPFLFAWQADGAPASLETSGLKATAAWARSQSDVNAMYFFPDLGRKPEPGIFRARAARAVYACWKQGGQVNYFAGYAEKWWERWSQLLAKGHASMDYQDLRNRGIDYLVLTKDQPKEPLPLVFQSPDRAYRVYRLRAVN